MNIKKIVSLFLALPRRNKKIIMILTDLIIGFSVIYFTFLILSSTNIIEIESIENREKLFLGSTFLVLIGIVFLNLLGHYSNALKYLSNKTLMYMFYIFLFILTSILFFSFIINLETIFFVTFVVLFFSGILISRLLAQSFFYKTAIRLKNILIYGAGVSGNKLYSSLTINNPEYNVVGFIDDDLEKQKERIDSIKIYSPKKIKYLTEKFDCYGIFIAMPSIDSYGKKEILMNLLDENLVIKIVPSVKSLVEKTSNFQDMRNIKIDDLINRSTVQPIPKLLKKNIEEKTILITGAGGSIGSELVSQVLKLNPKKVVAIDMSELSIFNLNNDTGNPNQLETYLGSLLDEKFMEIIFEKYNFDIVFHAAAYKHVSMVEKNIFYGVMNNVCSTFIISDFSIKYNVDNFVLVSTDKAVNPSNYMGKSKLISEIIVNQFSKLNKTNFSIVRFGNVLNSSGSVLSIFDSQIKMGGPLTVTHKDATRYFMSIPEASELIIQSSALFDQCRTFILEMGNPYNIYDLAKRIIQLDGFKVKENDNENGIEIKITGLKEGEKLHEELTIKKDSLQKTLHPKIYFTSEKYPEIDINNWIKALQLSYQEKEFDNFKRRIDELVKKQIAVN
tara:strand:+ start:3557 stop:5407 length:1851 start_codon:yes stop_codon:yes gene_type:complete